MIIKNIAKICRESRSLAIHRPDDGVQWIGDGAAFYAVPTLPLMTFNQACAAFDYSEKQKENIHEGTVRDKHHLLADSFPFETPIEELPEEISFNGRYYQLFRCAGRVFMIRSAYLTPLADVIGETFFFMRYVEDIPVLCVKRGLLAAAVIYPYMPEEQEIEKFCDDLSEMIHRLKTEYRKPQPAGDGFGDAEQITLDK